VSWELRVLPERCTGCRICMMICSWANEKNFQLVHAHIQVKNRDSEEACFEIAFDQYCKSCGICASYCPSGAIVKERRAPVVV